LLLAVVSTIFALDVPVFAQEVDPGTTKGGTSEESTMMEEEIVMQDDSAADDTTEDTMEEEVTEEMEEEEYVDSPRVQLMNGVDPHEVQCGEGLKLVFRANTFQPSCIKESSYEILSQRGWVSTHDPSHEELTAMMDKLPKPSEDEAMDDTMEEEMDETMDDTTEKTVEEEITEETSDAEPTPQNYTVDLSESMDMGAN